MHPYSYGATLLAIANGVNDLISGILASQNTEENDEAEQKGIYLAIGGLVGSSLFITTTVTAIMIFTTSSIKVNAL